MNLISSSSPTDNLERVYQTLGVPLYATTYTIKQAYRRLVKRWHPDLYPPGSEKQREATQMSELINAAYAAIEHAPLRYRSEGYSPYQARRSSFPSSASTYDSDTTRSFPDPARIEFWVRFICGFFFGIFIALDVASAFLDDYANLFHGHPLIIIVGVVTLAVASGLAAVRFGDRFWFWFFDRPRWY